MGPEAKALWRSPVAGVMRAALTAAAAAVLCAATAGDRQTKRDLSLDDASAQCRGGEIAGPSAELRPKVGDTSIIAQVLRMPSLLRRNGSLSQAKKTPSPVFADRSSLPSADPLTHCRVGPGLAIFLPRFCNHHWPWEDCRQHLPAELSGRASRDPNPVTPGVPPSRDETRRPELDLRARHAPRAALDVARLSGPTGARCPGAVPVRLAVHTNASAGYVQGARHLSNQHNLHHNQLHVISSV